MTQQQHTTNETHVAVAPSNLGYTCIYLVSQKKQARAFLR